MNGKNGHIENEWIIITFVKGIRHFIALPSAASIFYISTGFCVFFIFIGSREH